jgi:hypothetical protein
MMRRLFTGSAGQAHSPEKRYRHECELTFNLSSLFALTNVALIFEKWLTGVVSNIENHKLRPAQEKIFG